MWSHYLCLLLLVPLAVEGLNELETKFINEYFSYRNVRFICLLSSEDDYSHHKFTKLAAKQNIVVSTVKIGNNFNDFSKFKRCLRQDFPSIGVVVDTNCAEFGLVMEYASQNSLLDARHKWMILHESKNITTDEKDHKDSEIDLFPVLNNLNISVDSDIVMATKTAANGFQLYEIVNFGKIQGGDCIIKRSGKWEHNKHRKSPVFDKKLNEFKYYRRWNFHQLPIRMISVIASAQAKDFDPKILTDRKTTPLVATLTKTSAMILEVIFEIHNMRSVHSFADRWLGDFSFNQTKRIVSAAIYYKQQDISPVIRYLRDSIDKFDVVQPPVTSIETRYYYRIPTYGAGKFENQFLRPLSFGAWMCVVAMIVLCTIVLLISARLERRPASGQYAIFSVMASFCQQFFEDNSADVKENSSARKLTVLVTGISCVLIYNYYTSSVVSWLLNGPPPSINSLQELLESPLELIYEDIGYTRSWLQTPSYYYNKRNEKIEDDIRKKKVFNKKKDAPLLETLENGINMVKAGGYAYHTEVDSANRLISKTFDQRELCELGSLKSMDETPLYSCVQKNSPFKEFFTWSLMRLLERGIIRCIQDRTKSTSVKCEGSSPRALALGGAAPAFLLLALGYLLATVIMLVERALWRHKNDQRRHKRNLKRT